MEFVCIMCPMGCNLHVEKTANQIKVKGNSCPRGVIYGEKEATHPERMVTTIKKYKSGTISLKLSNPIAKEKVEDCLKEIAKCSQPKSIKIGDILIKNILNSGCDVVVTNINC
ncbi:MAG: DUF1667 domain-containing protein [Clostridia bacterium]|nr:DUF1667 domain-containing protein [Clostridia bacterium]